MAKLSKFGKAFNDARTAKKKVFDFGGKSYNTKLKKEGVGVAGSNKGKAPKSDMNSGPKKGAPMPMARPDMEGMMKAKKMMPVAVGFGAKKTPLPKSNFDKSKVKPVSAEKRSIRQGAAYSTNLGTSKKVEGGNVISGLKKAAKAMSNSSKMKY